MVGKAVGRSATAEFDAPELVDVQHAAIDVLHRADELAGHGIEGVNGALGKIVGVEQSVPERPEVIGSEGETPSLIQHAAAGELFQKRSVFAKDVNEAAGCGPGAGEGNVDEAVEVLNT